MRIQCHTFTTSRLISFDSSNEVATVTAALVFNNTNIAVLTVVGVPGFFELNLTTFTITHKLA